MSLPTVYFKKLVEVRVLHDYYLNSDKNPEYFALDDATRALILDAKINNDQYDIWADLFIEPTPETQKVMDGCHIRFVRQKTGFILGIRVKPDSNLNIPFIAPTTNSVFAFHVRLRNSHFLSFSNTRFATNTPAKYYFSNVDQTNALIYPSLSAPIAEFQTGRFYEMGEVAMLGSALMETTVRTSDNLPAHWQIIGSVGIVNESDRQLIPGLFTYIFERESTITHAVFNLYTPGGIIVKTITISDPIRLDRVSLDFRMVDSTAIPAGRYFLDVTGDVGYAQLLSIYINSDLYQREDLCVVELTNTGGASPFSLVDSGGLLPAITPVFEIRFKSRLTYWRYVSNNGIKFKTTAQTSPYLTAQNGKLRSILPLSMVAAPFEFKDPNPAIAHVFLPNPNVQSIRVENDGRVYSDIYIATIKDLIIEDV